jgi:Spy/CpxP family protein refolding chaperone
MLLKKVLGIALAAVWLFMPLTSYCENIPPGKWWRIPRLSDRLGLTEGQKRALDDLFVRSRRRLIDLKSAVEKERFELENLFEEEKLDEGTIMNHFRRLERARSDLANERFMFLLQVRKTLGLERYHRLKELFDEFKREKGSTPGRWFNRGLRPPR